MTSGNVHEAFWRCRYVCIASFASNSDRLKHWLAHACTSWPRIILSIICISSTETHVTVVILSWYFRYTLSWFYFYCKFFYSEMIAVTEKANIYTLLFKNVFSQYLQYVIIDSIRSWLMTKSRVYMFSFSVTAITGSSE